MSRNYLSLSLFFVPPLLLLAALDLDGKPSETIRISNIPFELSQPGFSGEACLSMFLQSCGYDFSQNRVFLASGLDPQKGRGCQADDLANAIRAIGMNSELEENRFRVSSRQANMQKIWYDTLVDLRRQIPSVFRLAGKRHETFVLMTGYDPKSDQVIYHEPGETNGQDRRLNRMLFLHACTTEVAKEQLVLMRLP